MLSFSKALCLVLCVPSNTLAQSFRYNEIIQKNSHNSYERREGLMDQLLYHAVRAIEIDCHPAVAAGKFGVYHDAGYFQSYSNVQTLDDAVRVFEEFHNIMPNHHVVTVWSDLKAVLGTTHTADDYDDPIRRLPLWTPSDARGGEATMQGGIDANGWPDLEDLRGKFIWILTSGQDSYCTSEEDCVTRAAFVAGKGITSVEDIRKYSYKLFFNQPVTNEDMGPEIAAAGFIGRVYDLSDIDSQEKWDNAIDHKFHHITTDKINYHKDTFSISHNAFGYPFLALNGTDVSSLKPLEGNLMYMTADSGDTWGRKDDANFAFVEEFAENQWIEYTSTVSLVNSHCDKFAKAGIMLRQEADEFPIGTGEYFAVVRTCGQFIRTQHRDLAWTFTEENIIDLTSNEIRVDGIEAAKRASLKVRYMYDGNDTMCEGYYKYEGTDQYQLIEKHIFLNVHLSLHGLFASSHYWGGNDDGTDYKVLFVDTRRDNVTLMAEDFDQYGDTIRFGDGFDYIQAVPLRDRHERSLRGVPDE